MRLFNWFRRRKPEPNVPNPFYIPESDLDAAIRKAWATNRDELLPDWELGETKRVYLDREYDNRIDPVRDIVMFMLVDPGNVAGSYRGYHLMLSTK